MKMENRLISIIFTTEYKNFISVYNKKTKEDYLLNVTKIIKDKYKTKFLVPNKIQSFIINYEIKKLLDKAINIKTKKYKRIIYLNNNLNFSFIYNSIQFIESEYKEVNFDYFLIKTEDKEINNINKIEKLKIIYL